MAETEDGKNFCGRCGRQIPPGRWWCVACRQQGAVRCSTAGNLEREAMHEYDRLRLKGRQERGRS